MLSRCLGLHSEGRWGGEGRNKGRAKQRSGRVSTYRPPRRAEPSSRPNHHRLPSIDLRERAPPTNEKFCNQMQLYHIYEHMNGVWCRGDARLMSSFISNEE